MSKLSASLLTLPVLALVACSGGGIVASESASEATPTNSNTATPTPNSTTPVSSATNSNSSSSSASNNIGSYSDFYKAVCANDPNLTGGTYYELKTPDSQDFMGETIEYYGAVEVSDIYFPLAKDGRFINPRQVYLKDLNMDAVTPIESCEGVS